MLSDGAVPTATGHALLQAAGVERALARRHARDLADLSRLGRLAEAWIAPPKTGELREMIRLIKLSHVRTGLKAQVHAVMA